MTNKIPCSLCEKTFGIASGLYWNSFHIHTETNEADKGSDGYQAEPRTALASGCGRDGPFS